MVGAGDESFELRDTLRDGAKRAHLGVGVVVAGKYKIVRHLGRGGMGVVFAARHLQLGHLVAIKVLHGDALDSTDVARFMREGRAAAKLESEHVVRIHDLGLLPTGHPYLVMEHLKGEDLGKFVATRGPMPIADATTIALQICEVLAEAHAAGVVHRDIKPQNVFLVTPKTASDPLCIKVLDFGLAKDSSSSSGKVGDTTRKRLTERHSLLGSPRFMSPEQIESAREVDGRTDIWATGATLYNLLTGRVPFLGRSIPEVLGQIMFVAPRPPRELRAEIAPELESVVMRCLEKSPAARYATMQELADALRSLAPSSHPFAAAAVHPPPAPDIRSHASPAHASPALASPPSRRGILIMGMVMVLSIALALLQLTSDDVSSSLPGFDAGPLSPATGGTSSETAPASPSVWKAPSPAVPESLDTWAPSRFVSPSKKGPRKAPVVAAPTETVPAERAPTTIVPAAAPSGKTCPKGEILIVGECVRL